MGSLISRLTGRNKVKELSDEDILDLKKKWFEKYYRQEDYIYDYATSTYACDKDTDINAEYMSSELR
jgi:hypothetical protein